METAQLASLAAQEAATAMKAAGERVHNAAVRAEQEARKLPGAGLAAGMAGGMPAAAEAASIAAARAFERLPGCLSGDGPGGRERRGHAGLEGD